MYINQVGNDFFIIPCVSVSKIKLFISIFMVLRQNFHRFCLFVAYLALCLIIFGKNWPKTIAGDENRPIFATETTKTARLSE